LRRLALVLLFLAACTWEVDHAAKDFNLDVTVPYCPIPDGGLEGGAKDAGRG
jgi:hypothetical protein